MAKIKQIQGKDYLLCPWRRKYVRLTPEEWVRQHVLSHLVSDCGYPHNLIGVEVPLTVGEVSKRADAIVYSMQLQPLMILEFKREDVALTQTVLDQASVYNRAMHVPYIVLSNGLQTIIARVTDNGYQFLSSIPTWTLLSA